MTHKKGKILVTGGAGYIGSHTSVVLQQFGYEVLIIDNLSNSDARILKQIQSISGVAPVFSQIDLCDKDQLDAFLTKHSGITGVIHFAAYKAVGESVVYPLKYYRNNLLSLLNLLDGMQAHGIPGLVFSSSCTVYGQPDKLPVNEDSPVKPAESPYGNTKQISEEIICDAAGSGELKAISLRYFNPIGAHESGLLGELPLGIPSNLVPFITQTAIGKREKLRVFGKDYNTPDGTCIRDYIHVMDLARAHLAALEYLPGMKDAPGYEVYNLGTGRGHSVLEAIRAFEKASGMVLPIEISGRRPGDIEQVWADTRLANLRLGWKAVYGIEEMMETAWLWEKNLAAGLLD